jgi:hypothetical protein
MNIGLSSSTADSRRSASGKTLRLGPILLHKALDLRRLRQSTAESSISRIVRRLRSTFSVRVRTTMPGATSATQAGTSTRAPSTSTTQMRHNALAVQCSW